MGFEQIYFRLDSKYRIYVISFKMNTPSSYLSFTIIFYTRLLISAI